MWICSRCHAENRDAAAACEVCGAMRAAGRFGSAPARTENAVPSPRISSPSVSAADHYPDRPAARSSAAPAEQAEERRKTQGKRSLLAAFSRLVGGILCVLLPLIVACLAWRQYDALSKALLPLLLPTEAEEAVRLTVYLALTLAAVLLALLPGLWTLLLARRAAAYHEKRERAA